VEIDCGICKVRSWRLGDAEAIVRHANNRKIWLNLRDRFPYPYSHRDAETYLRHVVMMQTEINFAIDLAGEAVGGLGFVPGTDVERHSAEVGYWLGESVWGRGIATAALKGSTRYAIEAYGLWRVFAVPFSENAASIRVLEKAGFLREGLMRRSAVKDGRILDQVLYAFIAETPSPEESTQH
jgi:ribosomal-protein-alanine N-acetyltransferase